MGIQDMRDRLRASESAHRRTWMPPADSLVYKSYNWWKQETGYSVPRENFCHFWRAATLYAAALYTKKKLAGPVSKSPVQTSITLMAFGLVQLLLTSFGLWPILPIILTIGLTVVGFGVGCYMQIRRDEGYKVRETIEYIADGEYFSLGAVLMYATFPLVVVGFCVAFLVNKLFDAIGDFADAILGILFAVAVLSVLVFGIASVTSETGWSWWLSTLAFAGGIVAVFAATAVIVAVCFGIFRSLKFGGEWTRRKFEQRQVYAPGTVDGRTVEREPNIIDKARQRIKNVLTSIWHVIRLAGEAIWVAKGLAICPYVDLPESESKKEDLKLETVSMG